MNVQIPELGILYVSWINEQLRGEIARREAEQVRQTRLAMNGWLRLLTGGLRPISIIAAAGVLWF